MKLRLSVLEVDGSSRDVTVSCDVTATIADVSRSLFRSGPHRELHRAKIAHARLAPVTLLVTPNLQHPVQLLDPMSFVGNSGLQSGWYVRPVLEFENPAHTPRQIDLAGLVTVQTGEQKGVQFSLVTGSCMLGRDPGCRVQLHEPSVSRRHAEIVIDVDGMRIRDLASSNGLWVDGQRVREARIDRPVSVQLGESEIRVDPGPPPRAAPTLTRFSHRVLHVRVPKVTPVFPVTRRTMPAAPESRNAGRIPMLAMLAPMLMGGALFAITRSPMSLMMVAFSPVMMIGSWVDQRLRGKRALKTAHASFHAALENERAELVQLREREVEMRAAEAPATDEVCRTVIERTPLLWSRRPEHRNFLEVRFGLGALPSRTHIELPERVNADPETWEKLADLQRSFREVLPVPITENLRRCGSIGVAGERHRSEQLAAALVIQLVGLHSPHELILTCFAGNNRTENWDWLKWLPHIDSRSCPIQGSQIADTARHASQLIGKLEELIAARRTSGERAASVWSDLDSAPSSGSADETGGRRDPPSPPVMPVVIVLVLDADAVELARLIELAEQGPDLGVYVVWVADNAEAIPAACRTFIDLSQHETLVHFVRRGSSVALSSHESVTPQTAAGVARSLAPIEDAAEREIDESDLPASVDLSALHPNSLVDGPETFTQQWADSDSLVSAWVAGSARKETPMSAVVGQGVGDLTVLDLREQGPHALVGGTTGAGKSEFLQSWIMSMAANISPDRMTFLLIDYKGGAAFAECVDLPHTVGLVTDLGPSLVRRALVSLRAELRYREEILVAHEAKDLMSMERCSNPAAPPTLVIVIDEFATLVHEAPEFIEGVLDIAQRGRSLGLHLVLATQRPAGVITANLRANTNLRIALRMADSADSCDVIGVPDAAHFPASMPGRAAFQSGPGKATHFQTGYLGGHNRGRPRNCQPEVRDLRLSEGEPWPLPFEPRVRSSATRLVRRDIERVRDNIVRAAELATIQQPRRPWLDELPKTITLRELGESGTDHGRPIIGLLDDPSAQTQMPLSLDFEEIGNLALIGAGGVGKTTALFALTVALAQDPENIQIFAIDAAGGALGGITKLPYVGVVAPAHDEELVRRTLQRVHNVVAERLLRFAEAQAGEESVHSRQFDPLKEPRVILFVDGIANFRQTAEGRPGRYSPMQLLSEIMLIGRAAGVHVVVSCDRPAALPAAISSTARKLVFRLTEPSDYGMVGVPNTLLEESPPGRAVWAGDDREIQLGIAGSSPELVDQTAYVEELAGRLRERGSLAVQAVTKVPRHISLSELDVQRAELPVYGINVETLQPVVMPICGLGVIAGPSGSGISQAALSCVAALEQWGRDRGEGLDSVLLSFANGGLQKARHWNFVPGGTAELGVVLDRLIDALGGNRGRADLGAGLSKTMMIGSSLEELIGKDDCDWAQSTGAAAEPVRSMVFPTAGRRGVIVVERPAEAEFLAYLPRLVELARAARRAEVLVLFEFEVGTAREVWELYQALKQPSWGIMLQADQNEPESPFRESFGRVSRTDFPPGRGFAVAAGRVVPVHVALSLPVDAQDSVQ